MIQNIKIFINGKIIDINNEENLNYFNKKLYKNPQKMK